MKPFISVFLVLFLAVAIFPIGITASKNFFPYELSIMGNTLTVTKTTAVSPDATVFGATYENEQLEKVQILGTISSETNWTEGKITFSLDEGERYRAFVFGDQLAPLAYSTKLKYNVSFNLNYTESTAAPENQSVLVGNTVSEPQPPTRTGYVFAGWYTEAACENSFDFTTPITTEQFLFAKWVEDPFLRKNIYSDSLYKIGIVPTMLTGNYIESRSIENAGGVRSVIFPVEYGKCYELQFPKQTQRLVIMRADSDPRNLPVGKTMEVTNLKGVSGTPTSADLKPFSYIPQKNGEFLVIYTGWSENISVDIYENMIISDSDTPGPWYTPSPVGDFLGNADSFADYSWTSEQVFENLYEPLREAYPDYITREHIGKDESGKYDMYCYIFEPENYEQSVFLSGGMHANEEDAYIALARFMQEVANEKGTNSQLQYLREKVRFVVIPIINVWATHGTHSVADANWNIRYNSTKTDLNRDFGDKTQQETKNVYAVLNKYGKDINFGIDFHTTPNDNGGDLFFNFGRWDADNASVNFKVTNHVYHRMVEENMIDPNAVRNMFTPSDSAYGTITQVNGVYENAPRTLQGHLSHEHGIYSLTVEYMNFTSGKNVPEKGSAEGLSMAVEIFGNFIIQNALFYAK